MNCACPRGDGKDLTCLRPSPSPHAGLTPGGWLPSVPIRPHDLLRAPCPGNLQALVTPLAFLFCADHLVGLVSVGRPLKTWSSLLYWLEWRAWHFTRASAVCTLGRRNRGWCHLSLSRAELFTRDSEGTSGHAVPLLEGALTRLTAGEETAQGGQLASRAPTVRSPRGSSYFPPDTPQPLLPRKTPDSVGRMARLQKARGRAALWPSPGGRCPHSCGLARWSRTAGPQARD